MPYKMPVEPEHGGNIYELAREEGWDPRRITDFSANINFLGPPESTYRIMRRARELLIHYPDPKARDFRTALGEYLGLAPEFIMAGNGAVEFIYLLIQALDPRSVLVTSPTFSEYAAAAANFGRELERIPLKPQNSFRLPVEAIVERLPGVDMLFLCNPNNPTGTLIPRRDLMRIARVAREHETIVVLDEAFLDFMSDPREYSLALDTARLENLVVLRSLTKFFALPGLRSGAMLAAPDLIQRVKAIANPWRMNALAQKASAAALRDTGYIQRSRQATGRERRNLLERLEAMGLELFPSPANFILIRLHDRETDASQLQEELLPHGVIIRNCSSFHGLSEEYIRIAVKSRRDNNLLLRLLKNLL